MFICLESCHEHIHNTSMWNACLRPKSYPAYLRQKKGYPAKECMQH
uniref:Uncharacterized protein n=1 Tax=Arundo donax TaxID=35708 RepID=A0A0A8ZDG0_ARUDO